MEADIKKCESVFKALSDATRLNIIKELNKQESTCVCVLVSDFNISQSKLSYHLKILLDAELIIMERHGKWNHYSLNKNQMKKYLSEDMISTILH